MRACITRITGKVQGLFQERECGAHVEGDLDEAVVEALAAQVSPAMALTSKMPSLMASRDTSKVPPPRSKISTCTGTALVNHHLDEHQRSPTQVRAEYLLRRTPVTCKR